MTTKRPTLHEQLEAECARWNIEIDDDGKRIVLDAPAGYQFDEELHALVSAPWDLDPYVAVLRRAISDARNYGPRIQKCPDNCPCKD